MGGILNYWSVPREWEGETAFLLGGGPSLRGFDPSVLDGRRVIAINNSWEIAPDADVLYFCDTSWWDRKSPKAEALAGYATNKAAVKAHFRGRYVASISDVRDSVVKPLRNAGKSGLSLMPDRVYHLTNSGAQAINLAFLFGAHRIVLMGIIEMAWDRAKASDPASYIHPSPEAIIVALNRIDELKKKGSDPMLTHWHVGHDRPAGEVNHRVGRVFLPHFLKLVEPLAAAGVEVLNATPGSALTCWPHVPLADILASDQVKREAA